MAEPRDPGRDARQRAEYAESFLQQVLEQSPVIINTFRGPDHVFVSVNARFRAITGKGAEIIGRPVREAQPELAGSGVYELLDRVYATGEPYVGTEIEVEMHGPGKGRSYFSMVYQPLVDERGAVTGIASVATDVTELVEARNRAEALQHEAEAARRMAEEATAAKSEFLATMSHELRTPLNAIGGYVQLLDMGLAGPVTTSQREYLGRLTASSHHLLGLVNDVLDLSRVDAGHVAVARESGSTADAVGAALALVAPQAAARNVRVADSAPRGVPYVADEHRVRQVLVNLLSNAVKFTPAGGTVTVRSGLVVDAPPEADLVGDGPWAYVQVADTGIGIPAAQQSAVFEPFVQAEAGHTRQHGGTGLGLTISRRLARLMGGDVTLQSVPGEGAAFTLWLPSTTQASMQSTGEQRAVRLTPTVTGSRVEGIAELGAYLRLHVEEVVDAFVERLRRDSVTAPAAASANRRQLEDHTPTLLANLAQSLVVVEETGGLQSDLLKDGGEIQRVVAELHGRQRERLGWTAAQLAREAVLLGEEVERVVRRRAASPETAQMVDVLRRLLARAGETSARAFRHASGG